MFLIISGVIVVIVLLLALRRYKAAEFVYYALVVAVVLGALYGIWEYWQHKNFSVVGLACIVILVFDLSMWLFEKVFGPDDGDGWV